MERLRFSVVFFLRCCAHPLWERYYRLMCLLAAYRVLTAKVWIFDKVLTLACPIANLWMLGLFRRYQAVLRAEMDHLKARVASRNAPG